MLNLGATCVFFKKKTGASRFILYLEWRVDAAHKSIQNVDALMFVQEDEGKESL